MRRIFAGMLLAGGLMAGWAVAAPVFDTMLCNEKAQDLRLQVSYPEGWTAVSTGSSLASFSRKQGDLDEMLTLQVSRVAADYAQKLFAVPGAMAQDARYERWRGIVESSQRGAKVMTVSDRQMADGRPAVLVEMLVYPENGGFKRFMQSQMLQVYESGRMITVSCAVMGRPDQDIAVGLLLRQNRPSVCEPYFASLRLIDQKEINDAVGCDGSVAAGGWGWMGIAIDAGFRYGGGREGQGPASAGVLPGRLEGRAGGWQKSADKVFP